MIERGRYGLINIIAGKHEGQIGYYDDDDFIDFDTCKRCIENDLEDLCNECQRAAEGASRAIVYLGEPFKSECILLRFDQGEHVLKNTRSLKLEGFKKEYPDLCKNLGVE